MVRGAPLHASGHRASAAWACVASIGRTALSRPSRLFIEAGTPLSAGSWRAARGFPSRELQERTQWPQATSPASAWAQLRPADPLKGRRAL